ncbi:MAG: ATP-dependent helicase [Bdellovibrionales bacterium]
MWLQNLNPEQQQAVQHHEGPMLILAGAGSGKTTVLVSRTGYLIDHYGVNPKRMLALTFTNKAARELKERVAHKLGDRAEYLRAGTFHSFGVYLLRLFHKQAGLSKYFGIIDQNDAQSMVKELLKDLKFPGKDNFDTEALLNQISQWREVGQTKAKTHQEYDIVTEWLLPRYIQKLENLGVVDFDSLILKPVELIQKDPEIKTKVAHLFDQVMIDEFQDTNIGQMRLVKEMVTAHRNITVVGDDDQSIYGWRGACIQNILDFPKTFHPCKVVKLEQNYRSSQKILHLANTVIQKNPMRHNKVLKPGLIQKATDIPELFVFESDEQEIEGIFRELNSFLKNGVEPRQIAILYRSNSQGALFEVECRKQKIPYEISGGTGFFDRKEIKDVLAYIRCSQHPNEVSFRRILNTPNRGIGDQSVELLSNYAKTHNLPFHKAAIQWQEAQVNEKAGQSIESLFTLLRDLKPNLLGGPETPGERLKMFLLGMGYDKYLASVSKDALAAQKRWNLVQIFCQVMDRILSKMDRNDPKVLMEFANFMELRDSDSDEEKNQIQLMTLHAAKGLEFDVVILAGLDEDILPHKSLGEDPTEERRLFYVGITRARKRLIITRAKNRVRYGKSYPATPSRFITDIPAELLTTYALGWRPVTEDQRKNLLQDLYKKLEAPATTTEK